jgi:hypothetical protein
LRTARVEAPELRILLSAVLLIAAGSADALSDHHELEATLHLTPREHAIDVEVAAQFPLSPARTQTFYTLTLKSPQGTALRTQVGEITLGEGNQVRTQRSFSTAGLPAGFYTVTLTATALEPEQLTQFRDGTPTERVSQALAFAPNGVTEQQWDVRVGNPPLPVMPAFVGLKHAAEKSADPPGGLPYRVYFGNLHSQTNHSDGGGEVATCTHASGAQDGAYDPLVAYDYARDHGLDLLMASEHNHDFDGNGVGTNANGTPAFANGLYQSGLQIALDYNLAHSDFLALYGMEWGVTTGGGHLNIFGSSELYNWEYNSSNQLLGQVYTEKSNYAALYTLMRSNGLVGQFNHPDTSGQFLVGGTALGYHADGDEVMVLGEVMNTSAFSNDTTETETSRSSFEGAFKRLLERGFHIAPATNQDNHCANWGASYSNRTAILLPTTATLTPSTFLEAVRARRVFATMDKSSQIILKSGTHLMGERVSNEGTLPLEVLYATTGGHTVTRVEIFEGVPGRNGTVTTLIEAATHTFTPATGPHFYYARITQEDGDLLWSAPLWVEQQSALLVDGFE